MGETDSLKAPMLESAFAEHGVRLSPHRRARGHAPPAPDPLLPSDLKILEVRDGSTAAVFSNTLTSVFV